MSRTAGALFAACAAPRLIALAVTRQPEPNFYWRIADSLLTTHRFALDGAPAGAYEPLYPLFLAAARAVTADRFALVMLIQALVASAAGVLLFHLTGRATGSRRAAVAATLFYAVYPYYVRQSVAPIEVTLSVSLLVAAAWQYGRMDRLPAAALLGLCMGLLLLLRVMFAPVGMALLLILALGGQWRHAVVVAAATAAVVAPWAALSRAHDRAIVPSRAGENLYVSVCDPGAHALPKYDVDLVVPQAYAAVDADGIGARLPPAAAERAVNTALLDRAFDCIRERPLETVRLRLRNLLYVFSPELLPAHARLPRPRAIVTDGRLSFTGVHDRPFVERASHFTAHLVITALAVVGLWRRRRHWREDALLLVMLANTAIVYAVFFPTTRLVVPTAFVLMFYAGSAVGRKDGGASIFRGSSGAAPRRR